MTADLNIRADHVLGAKLVEEAVSLYKICSSYDKEVRRMPRKVYLKGLKRGCSIAYRNAYDRLIDLLVEHFEIPGHCRCNLESDIWRYANHGEVRSYLSDVTGLPPTPQPKDNWEGPEEFA